MTPSPSLFLYLKLGLVSIVVIGIFVLAGMGKIDATTAITSVVATIGALVVALGISGSGSAQAQATRAAAGAPASDPPKPSVRPPSGETASILSLQSQLDAIKAKSGQSGFGAVGLLVGIAIVGLLVACFLLAPMHLPALVVVLGVFFAVLLVRSRVNVRRRVGNAFGVGAMLVTLGIAGGGIGANCTPPPVTPQTAQDIQAGVILADCMLTVYETDSQKVPAVTAQQILIDEGEQCGPDLPAVVTIFGKRHPDVAAAAQANPSALATASAHYHAKQGH